MASLYASPSESRIARKLNAIAAAAITAPSARNGPDAGEGRFAPTATSRPTMASVQASHEKYALASPAALGLESRVLPTSLKLKPVVDPESLSQVTAVNEMIKRMKPMPANVAPTTPNCAPLPTG